MIAPEQAYRQPWVDEQKLPSVQLSASSMDIPANTLAF
jgi:hypothetical protein